MILEAISIFHQEICHNNQKKIPTSVLTIQATIQFLAIPTVIQIRDRMTHLMKQLGKITRPTNGPIHTQLWHLQFFQMLLYPLFQWLQSPVNYFKQFFSQELFDLIIVEMNQYGKTKDKDLDTIITEKFHWVYI